MVIGRNNKFFTENLVLLALFVLFNFFSRSLSLSSSLLQKSRIEKELLNLLIIWLLCRYVLFHLRFINRNVLYVWNPIRVQSELYFIMPRHISLLFLLAYGTNQLPTGLKREKAESFYWSLWPSIDQYDGFLCLQR